MEGRLFPLAGGACWEPSRASESLFFVLPARLAFAGICARLRTHFSLSRQRKVSNRKATPLSATRSFAAGNLSCGDLAGNRSNSLRSDNRGSFSRQTATTQAHTEGAKQIPLVALCATLRQRAGAGYPSRCNARQRRASRAISDAVVHRRVAQGWADQGTRLFERSEFERPPAQTEQRSVPEALLRDDAFGSPFLCLLSFGEAKESKCAAGRISRPARAAVARKINKTNIRPSGRDPAPVREGTIQC